MSSERHEKLYDLFRRACEFQGVERTAFLDEACVDEERLRSEVEALLKNDSATNPLDRPMGMGSAIDGLHVAEDPKELIGTKVGKYRITRLLGEGGMGIVYLAEQDSPRRSVALKVLSAHATTAQKLARFELESDVLARLQHPGIAQVYETGSAKIGGQEQPFFAMEFVEGATLLEHALSDELNDAQRLELVIQLCEAVHHAHQKGVIHRDLKPANILVNESGQLKVLDFGIARLTDSDLRATTIKTNVGDLIGTLPYMSPEQAAGNASDLDVRSDVYALGVIAYELLSGRLPYDLSQKMIHEAVRVVQESSPDPLSDVLPHLRGDVETIVGKALEKEPVRRYQSALGMAEDIERHLRDEPIMARPASVAYQLRKFARRNTLLVGSAATIVALLIAGVVGVSMLAWKIRQQRDVAIHLKEEAETARTRAETAQAAAEEAVYVQRIITGFLHDVFAAGTPMMGNKGMTVSDAVDIAARHVNERLSSQPAVAHLVRQQLSSTYFSLGKVQESLEQMEGALAAAQKLTPPNPIDVASMQAGLGHLHAQAGNTDQAKKHLEIAMSLIDDPAVHNSPARSLTLLNYSMLLLGERRFSEALPLLDEALQLREARFGADHPNTMTVRNNMAVVARNAGNLEEALRLAKETMESHRRVLGDKHLHTIGAIHNYADLLRELEQFDESEQWFKQGLELATAHLMTRDFRTGFYHTGYGEVLRVQKRWDLAERELKLGFEILQEQLGPQHAKTKRALRRVIQLYEDSDRPDDAAEYREKRDNANKAISR